jgi:acyl-CoA thioester hydrolase
MTTASRDRAAASSEFVERVRVRYGECDQQGIVFNANYLAYADDVIGQWFRAAIGSWEESGFDCMVKKASLEWSTPARPGDIIEFRPSITRWGNSSFDITMEATVDGRHIVDIVLLYVSVTPGTHTPCPVPARIREALDALQVTAD